MKELLKRLWYEEDGMGTVEIIIIIAVLVAVALVFKDGIMDFVNKLMNKFFADPGEIEGTYDPNKTFGG